MAKYNLDDIKKMVHDLAEKVDAPESTLPAFYSTDTDRAFIELDHKGDIHYIYKERGVVVFDEAACNIEGVVDVELDAVLYEVFKNATFDMSLNYEFANRIHGKDCRRLSFAKQEELLGVLRIEWRFRREQEHDEILRDAPFYDKFQ